MAYIKQTWIDNESPLTAERMNHIEDGISNNDVSITSLDTRINSLAGGGQPIVVSQASDMTDQTKIYLYVGEETGYETGHWYYYDTTWTDGGQYGADGGINGNARNLLKYILEHVAYTQTGMQVYVDALYQALAQSGGGDEPTTYMIMNALTHVTNSNDATGADEGDSYTATLTPDTDYTIDSVVITMGGTDITSTAYDSSDDSITIASVTGDVIITASASTRFAVEYQGNFTTSSPSTTRVTLITNDITLEYGETLTVTVPEGYRLYTGIEIVGVPKTSPLIRTAKETNRIYGWGINNDNQYEYDDGTIFYSGASSGTPRRIATTTGWATSKTLYVLNSSTPSITFTGFAMFIDKGGTTDITIEEAKSVVNWTIS